MVFYAKPELNTIHIGSIVIYNNGKGYVIHEVVSYNNNQYITKGTDPYTNPLPDNQLGIEPPNGITLTYDIVQSYPVRRFYA